MSLPNLEIFLTNLCCSRVLRAKKLANYRYDFKQSFDNLFQDNTNFRSYLNKEIEIFRNELKERENVLTEIRIIEFDKYAFNNLKRVLKD